MLLLLLVLFLHIYLTHPPPVLYGSVAFTLNHVSVPVSLSLSKKKKKRSEVDGSVEVCFIRIQQTRSCIFQPTPAAHPISLCTMHSRGRVALHNGVGWIHRNVLEQARGGGQNSGLCEWVGSN